RGDVFNLRPALVLLFLDSVIISCIVTASILGCLTLRCIHKAEKISENTRVLQRKLLIVICAQTAVPVFCVYVPYFIMMTFPFFGLADYIVTGGMTVLNSAFPALDAIVIIVLMTDYRRGLLSML
ncbi:hypothetical protein PFISCL1PPCAC_13893, partial [Pristionchus fissidentatus]